jgi:hypothetical protein
MRYRLRTLLTGSAMGPPVLAAAWQARGLPQTPILAEPLVMVGAVLPGSVSLAVAGIAAAWLVDATTALGARLQNRK